jgi:hypothetical protein
MHQQIMEVVLWIAAERKNSDSLRSFLPPNSRSLVECHISTCIIKSSVTPVHHQVIGHICSSSGHRSHLFIFRSSVTPVHHHLYNRVHHHHRIDSRPLQFVVLLVEGRHLIGKHSSKSAMTAAVSLPCSGRSSTPPTSAAGATAAA